MRSSNDWSAILHLSLVPPINRVRSWAVARASRVTAATRASLSPTPFAWSAFERAECYREVVVFPDAIQKHGFRQLHN